MDRIKEIRQRAKDRGLYNNSPGIALADLDYLLKEIDVLTQARDFHYEAANKWCAEAMRLKGE